nr:MAG TPA: hypothetical protein [Caudoviricetes sp.]
MGLLPIQRKTTTFEKQAHTCERGDSVFPLVYTTQIPRRSTASYSVHLAACYYSKTELIYTQRKGNQAKNKIFGGNEND